MLTSVTHLCIATHMYMYVGLDKHGVCAKREQADDGEHTQRRHDDDEEEATTSATMTKLTFEGNKDDESAS